MTDYDIKLLQGWFNGSITTEIVEMCENLAMVFDLEQRGYIAVLDGEFVELTEEGLNAIGQ